MVDWDRDLGDVVLGEHELYHGVWRYSTAHRSGRPFEHDFTSWHVTWDFICWVPKFLSSSKLESVYIHTPHGWLDEGLKRTYVAAAFVSAAVASLGSAR